ncbi:SH3 domain-containing protein [Sinorhizobium americanum]|uniref:Uncharacterized protein n=1 Tax=Sinorhizobium americanum TaxID=194963 RepID=A0A1L3LUX4_9HYPH|nr:SH3 domain-containing protein [Sinorhizobium americanum]APG93909.1 hypothetical protein SAMCFNEI73_pC0185 [Sinorhizobium americanum]OAP40188.1 peptide-binding protein [Sinorhizobium americanum]
MKRALLKIAATGILLLAPAIAQAAEGFATANVNMRAGPSTAYPAVTIIPAGESIEIYGCLADVPWCDVEFYDGRGWVHGRYIQALYQQRRVYLGPQYYRRLGIPVVVFSFSSYWDRHYRDREFYRDRDRWRRGPNFYRGPDHRAEPSPRRRREFEQSPAPLPEFDRRLEPRPDFSRTPERRRDFDDRPERLPDFDRAPNRRRDIDRQQDFDRDLRGGGDRNRRNFERGGDDGNRVIRRGDDNRGRSGGDKDRRGPQRSVCQPGDPDCPN